MYYIEVVEDFNLFDFVDENEINKKTYIEDNLSDVVKRISNIVIETNIPKNETKQLLLSSNGYMNLLHSDELSEQYLDESINRAFRNNDDIKVTLMSTEDEDDCTTSLSTYMYSIYIKNEKSYVESIL